MENADSTYEDAEPCPACGTMIWPPTAQELAYHRAGRECQEIRCQALLAREARTPSEVAS